MQRTIGIIGLGTVGLALYRQLSELPFYHIKSVGVRSAEKKREVDADLITTRPEDIANDPDIDIVMEAIDDPVAALEFARQSLRNGKIFISANKKMIANHLEELNQLKKAFGGGLYYEAAVGGAIPVLRTINDHLADEPIEHIRGIVNGSCNYILTRMAEDHLEFEAALAEAQELGYAETDPGLDIDGWDSYFKAIILATNAFREFPNLRQVRWKGIRQLTRKDVLSARKRGNKVKLIADIRKVDGRAEIAVEPQEITPDDLLYPIDGVLNGIAIRGKFSGELLLQGPGAGGNATASAMTGDLHHARRSWMVLRPVEDGIH